MSNVNKFKYFKFLIIFIVLSILGSCLVVTFSLYQLKQKELQMLSSHLYGPSPFVFMSTNKEDSEIINNFSEIKEEAFTVFYEIDELSKGYYFHKENYMPPMIKGRFFDEGDFYNQKKIAVVGKNVSESIIKEIKESDYEIIGVMGADYQSDIDRLVYYNLDSLIDLEKESNPFILVSDKNIEAILSELKIQSFDDVYIIQRNSKGTFNFVTDESFHPFLTAIILLLLALYSFTMIYCYYFDKNNEIKILWLMGVHYNSFFRVSIMNFILTFTGTYFIISFLSFIYIFVQSQVERLALGHLNNLVTVFFLILFFSMVGIIYFYIRTILKFRLEEYTK